MEWKDEPGDDRQATIVVKVALESSPEPVALGIIFYADGKTAYLKNPTYTGDDDAEADAIVRMKMMEAAASL